MPDFAKNISQAGDVPVDQARKIGQPVAGDLDEEHRNFLKTLFALLDSGKIDPFNTKTFLKMDVYEALDEEWQDKVDLSLYSIATQVGKINELRKAEDVPEESLQLKTMVEQLWQMKQRIEEHHDVFKF